MPSFLPGQRYTSDTEPELGVGEVVQVEGRTVVFSFAAADSIRTYAMASAPVRRVRFREGDPVRRRDGKEAVVQSIREEEGLLVYATHLGDLREPDLDPFQSLNGPRDRLLAGHVDGPEAFTLRARARLHHAGWAGSEARGFAGARIDLLPHQLYIAHEVASRVHPRVLLADEVGLGKTIEAALILHRLLRAGRIQRVLVLVPEALLHQWFVELLRRFNLSFRLFDADRTSQIADEPIDPKDADQNPFLQESLVLTAPSVLLAHPALSEAAVSAGWDLVVVDEAHHLAWDPDQPSPEYTLVERLGKANPSLLLLTATPEQLGLESHFARLRLLDPERYFDLERFRHESDGYRAAAETAAKLEAAGDEAGLSDLIDRHGPGRVMFRNTRHALQGFPQRRPHPVALEPGKDAREIWLLELLQEQADEKVLLITRTPRDVLRLRDWLEARTRIPVAVFHEGLPLVQRDRQAAWFAEPEGARVLLASEIGGEGRNFQFAHHLVLWDLPDDPEVLEQRIGRLDRIGQTSDIHVHVPYFQGTAEETLARWYHEGLNAFAHALPAGRVFRRFWEAHLHEPLESLVEKTAAYRKQVEADLEAGRDRLLEMGSLRPTVAARVVEAIREADHDNTLPAFLTRLCDRFGVLMEAGDDATAILKPGPLYHEEFPLPRAEGCTVTWDRALALSREDLVFVSWDHPMITDSIELLLASEPGTAAFALWPDTGKRGVIVEALYVIECPAPPRLHAERFLAPQPLMLRIDQHGQPCDAPDEDRLLEADAHVVIDHVQFREKVLPQALAKAAERAEAEAATWRDRALTEAERTLAQEIDRLRYLRTVNDHVRESEITDSETLRDELLTALTHTAPRLDALRVVLLAP